MSMARRIEILVDRPLLRRVTAAADAAGVTNYALLPTLGGRDGADIWSQDQLTGATDRILFTTVLAADKAEALAIVRIWLATEFEGGRHIARINKIDAV